MINQEPKSLQALLLAIYLLIGISKLAFLTSAIFLLAHHQTTIATYFLIGSPIVYLLAGLAESIILNKLDWERK